MEFDKYVEHAQWVFNHITKLESGCWQWTGKANKLGIHRIVADLCGMRYPIGVTVYHMPECVLGDACVNPEHVGTREEWNHVVKQALAPKGSVPTPQKIAYLNLESKTADLQREIGNYAEPSQPDVKDFYGKVFRRPGIDRVGGTWMRAAYPSGQSNRNVLLWRAADHKWLKELRVLWEGDNRDERQ